jgi:hypothetical protein
MKPFTSYFLSSTSVKGKIAPHPKKEAMKKNHRLIQIPNCLCPIP